MHVRAYAYIRTYGSDLREVSRHAVLNANYIRAKLRGIYPMPYDRICAHEFVMEGHFEGVEDVHALDISKRLMDYGIHPPTNYFPLIVPEALLDRADRDRGQGDARQLHRGDEDDRAGSARRARTC